jgi:tryptophan 2,3-dioxygenase
MTTQSGGILLIPTLYHLGKGTRNIMSNKKNGTYYGDYLMLDQLTGSQVPKSKELGQEAHDEMLFIIVHQVYELWFKQIIHEFNSILKTFSQENVPSSDLSQVVARLERVIKIQSLLLDQMTVMETMTPMDFLEFRDLLVPASGFQSVQFREIEVRMGLRTNNRKSVDRDYFLGRLSERDKQKVLDCEKDKSLLEHLNDWLERMPFTSMKDFNFWGEFETKIHKMIDKDEQTILANAAGLPERALKMQLANLESTKATYASLFNEEAHLKLKEEGARKLSRKATMNALFILLYRHEPMLQAPHRLLTSLMDIDENFTTWRYRHALMAQRMLGTKIGTGGSSGHHYLKMAAENNRVYEDLFNLSTFLISNSELPIIPPSIKDKLNFDYEKI